MAAETDISRPNIRIQIFNNAKNSTKEEAMEVDSMEVKENEEGEISDGDDNMEEDVEQGANNKISSDIRPTFTTGINIFDKREQEKLQERAKRFALKPDEINSFTDENLEELRDSLGINHTNESDFKFETIHLLGLGEMTPEDIVDYFSNYAPEGIEYLDHDSCNVVWLDNLSAARALHYKSRVVRGMPARESKDTFPKEFLDDVEDHVEDGQSILIKNKNREIELQNEIGEVIQPKKKTYPKNSVDISDITVRIPPGYWRLGLEHPKTKCLLMRFGKVTDKIPYKSEKCSRYFKKVQSKTGISESKKQELRGIFERNKELDSKNPWGSLARNWERDAKFREREPIMYGEKSEDDVEIVAVKNPKLQARLGKKKVPEPREEEPLEEEEDLRNPRLHLERENLPEKKKTKVPRMKMYADEEEETQKRRKILMKIKKQTEEIEKKNSQVDLRNMLGPSNRLLLKKEEPVPAVDVSRQADLGSRLKNRSQRMIFAVERERDSHYDIRDVRRDIQFRPDRTRQIINRDRSRSPVQHRAVLLRHREAELESRHEHDDRERERRLRTNRRSSAERTLHSDRMHSSRSSHLRRRSHSSSEGKPRSKVAVVVPRRPAVASTIWSKVKQSESSESDSESESESSSSSSSGSSESESDSDSSRSSEKRIKARNPDRPGFDKSRLSAKVDHKSPLKITTKNEHFKQKKASRRA